MAAIEWMTTQMELRDEIADMDRAMQVSLKEAEQERQKQKTPAEMEEEQLLSHFRGSVLIPKVGSNCTVTDLVRVALHGVYLQS